MKNLIVLVGFIFLLSGCNNAMNELQIKIEDLIASSEASDEKNNAEILNDYSNDNHVAYQLEIKNAVDSSLIEISSLSDHMNEKINVTISIDENSWHAFWSPVDNNNIYILLRE